ncbi:hypothetical protein CR513_54230, partial [Mucuna pruriens]
MRYLQRTKEYVLVYRRVDNLEIVGYINSYPSGCLDDRKSTFRYVFMMVGGKSEKQTLVASSTMQTGFIACFATSTHVVWLSNLMVRLCIVESIAKSLRIFCDNIVAMFYTKNNKASNICKHLELKYLIIRYLAKDDFTVVEHVDIDFMLVDRLTEGLRPIVHIWQNYILIQRLKGPPEHRTKLAYK